MLTKIHNFWKFFYQCSDFMELFKANGLLMWNISMLPRLFRNPKIFSQTLFFFQNQEASVFTKYIRVAFLVCPWKEVLTSQTFSLNVCTIKSQVTNEPIVCSQRQWINSFGFFSLAFTKNKCFVKPFAPKCSQMRVFFLCSFSIILI